MTPEQKKEWHGDCPTCIYTYSVCKEFRRGMRLCTHPAGELYSIEGLVSPCDGWVENKGA